MAALGDLLTCPVCYRPFDDAGAKPVDLGCGHCFCEACISHSPRSFTRCPECRARSSNQHVSVTLLRFIRESSSARAAGAGADAAATEAAGGIAAAGRQAAASAVAAAAASASYSGVGAARRPVAGEAAAPPPPLPPQGRGGCFRAFTYLAAFLYIISPLDALPDIIPGLGLLDDLVVLIWLLYSFLGGRFYILEKRQQE